MRGLGIAFAGGVAAIVLWKVMAVFVFGLMGMALKVGLVVLVVWLVLKLFNGKCKKEEEE